MAPNNRLLDVDAVFLATNEHRKCSPPLRHSRNISYWLPLVFISTRIPDFSASEMTM